ncbi:MAG: DUF6056 family protein [Butyrivibrio sp.]|nr:DUF6056 family protein [Butyrivibrio sp.]
MQFDKKISIKTISYVLTGVYILCLIPLLAIAFFNYPSADDFSMGYRAYSDFVASGGNVFAAIGAAAYMAWYDYFNWMGYYTSTFFLSLPPSVFDERLYFLGAFIILGALSFGYIYFFRALFVRVMHKDPHLVNCLTMLTLILSVECLPKEGARVESIYWYCSAANYTLMFAFLLMYVGVLLSYLVEEKKGKKIYYLIMGSLLGILVGGGNYMTSLTGAMFTVLFAIAVFVLKKDKPVIIPGIVNLIAFFFSIIAPGNSVRESIISGFGPVKTVLISIYYVLDYCMDQWTTWAVLLLFLMMLPFMWKLSKNCPLSFKYPVPVLFAAYTFAAANVAPPLYSLANIGAGRLQATFFFQFILLIVLSLFYVCGWIRTKVEAVGRIEEDDENLNLGRGFGAFFAVVAALFVVFSGFTVIPDPDYFSSTCAIEDMLNGHAQRFAQQNLERRAILRDESVQDVVLDYYEYEPDLLFYADITTDPKDWTNNSVARYYGKNSVVRTERKK